MENVIQILWKYLCLKIGFCGETLEKMHIIWYNNTKEVLIMKLCRKCLTELFDRDAICPTCKSNSFIVDETLNKIKSEIMSASKRKRNLLLKNPEYQSVYDYIQKKSNCKRPDVLELSDDKNVEVCPSLFKEEQSEESNNHIPKCPTCGSPDVEKISLTSKAVGGALFGLFSSNVRKTMHCKNCGYKW